MKIPRATGLLVADLMRSNVRHAQTWDAPLHRANGDLIFNSCAMWLQPLQMDCQSFGSMRWTSSTTPANRSEMHQCH